MLPFSVLYLQPLCYLVQTRSVARWRALSNGTPASERLCNPYGKVSVVQSIYSDCTTGMSFNSVFGRTLVFCPPSRYPCCALNDVNLENPSCQTSSEIEWPMRRAPTICPRSKASKAGTLPILASLRTNSSLG
ncbi:hypothetical protein TNCV_2460211 [Trichonephila clavipes]|nr:hypothetical protein TNCV_2460211 [Trichonephila clavipes]